MLSAWFSVALLIWGLIPGLTFVSSLLGVNVVHFCVVKLDGPFLK